MNVQFFVNGKNEVLVALPGRLASAPDRFETADVGETVEITIHCADGREIVLPRPPAGPIAVAVKSLDRLHFVTPETGHMDIRRKAA